MWVMNCVRYYEHNRSHISDEEMEVINEDADVSLRVLNNMRNADSKWCLYDVVLLVEDERFPVHRALLGEVSPFFAALFGNGMKESDKNEVTIREVNKNKFRYVLDFIYAVPFTLNGTDIALDLLELAFRFQLKSLENSLVNWLCESVRWNYEHYVKILEFTADFHIPLLVNVIARTIRTKLHLMHNTCDRVGVLKIANESKMQPVLDAIVMNIKRNFSAMYETKVLMNLQFEQVTSIICHVLRGSSSILEMIHAIAKWSSHNNNAKQTQHLLGLVPVHDACKKDLEIIDKHEVTKRSKKFGKEVTTILRCKFTNRQNNFISRGYKR